MPQKRHKKLIYKIFVIAIIILLFGVYSYKHSISTPFDKGNTENISFVIKKGESVKDTCKNLETDKLIKSSTFFCLFLKLNNLDKNIIAGRFLLNQSLTPKEIAEKITNIQLSEAVLTIQEGLTIRDIDKKLVDMNLITEGEFISAVKNFDGYKYYDFLNPEILKNLDYPLEGYLYPDTYFLTPTGFDPKDVIYLALDNFENKIKGLNIDKTKIHEVLTLASIVENEVFGEENRKLVAGILKKRMANGWTLGADITLLYLKNDRKITSADLESDSPYNTRKNQGLPPSPIGNPSIESISAVLNSKDSPYWFYLTAKDGEVIYAKTNEEQNVNRAKYLN